MMKAHFDHGPGSPEYIAAIKHLDNTKVEAMGHVDPSSMDYYISQGKQEWEAKIKENKDAAHLKVGSAIYNYEFAVLNNAPAEEIAEFKLQMDHAKAAETKYFMAQEMEELAAQKQTQAKIQILSNNALKNLGANLKAKLQSIDAFAEDFAYPAPAHSVYGSKDKGSDSKDAKFKAVQQAQKPKLTGAETDYMHSYSASAFTDLNRAAGKFGSSGQLPAWYTRNNIELLDGAMEKITLGENVRLNRVMAQRWLAEAFGLGKTLKTATPEQLATMLGKTYTEGAFSSTSMSPDWGSGFSGAVSESGKVHMRIRAGADVHGIRIASFASNPGEQEVLLARGTTYVIRAVRREGTSIYMDVDVVGQLPKPLPPKTASHGY
jgi:hypothetical protein